MQILTEDRVRACFVNATKGEVARINLPPDLADHPGDPDLLAWVDPKAPLKGYLVVPTPDHGLVGVQLKRTEAGGPSRRARMCSLCTTVHGGQGVALMVAPRAGRSGRDGNTVGLEMCSSLGCAGYAHGTLRPPSLSAVHETLTVDERMARLRRNALAFVERVLKP